LDLMNLEYSIGLENYIEGILTDKLIDENDPNVKYTVNGKLEEEVLSKKE